MSALPLCGHRRCLRSSFVCALAFAGLARGGRAFLARMCVACLVLPALNWHGMVVRQHTCGRSSCLPSSRLGCFISFRRRRHVVVASCRVARFGEPAGSATGEAQRIRNGPGHRVARRSPSVGQCRHRAVGHVTRQVAGRECDRMTPMFALCLQSCQPCHTKVD